MRDMLGAVAGDAQQGLRVFFVYARCIVNAHITCPTKGLRVIQ